VNRLKKTISNILFLIILTIITLFVSYGLALISDGENYYYGVELLGVFIIILYVMFMSEILKNHSFKDLEKNILHRIYYKKILIFPVSLIIISIIIYLTSSELYIANLPYFLFPILIILGSIDITADVFVYIHATNKYKINTNLKTILVFIIYPLLFISVITLVGEYVDLNIWILIILAISLSFVTKLITYLRVK